MKQSGAITKISAAIIAVIILVSIVVGVWYATKPGEEEEFVTITMVYWPGPESEALEPVLEWYNSERAPETGIKVEMVCFSRAEFFTKQDTFLAAGSSDYDIITAGTYNIAHYAPHMVDIEDIKDEVDALGCLKTHLDGLTIDGKLYGIPCLGLNNWAFFYREDLINDLLTDNEKQETYKRISEEYIGKEITPKHPDDWLLEDWIATALYFTRGVNPDSPTVYGTAAYGKTGGFFTGWPLMNIVWLYGGRWFKPGTLEPDFTSEAWLNGMNIYDNFRKWGIWPTEMYNWEYPDVDGALRSGLIAFAGHFSIQWAALNDPEQTEYAGKFVMTRPPGLLQSDGTIKRYLYVNPVGLGVTKYSKHQEEAKMFLLEMLSPEMERRYVAEGGVPQTAAIIAEASATRPDLAIDLELIDKYGFTVPVLPETISIQVAMSGHISGVIAGTETPEEALSAIQAEVEEILGV